MSGRFTGMVTGNRDLSKQPISVHVRDKDAELNGIQKVTAKLGGAPGIIVPERTGRVKLTCEAPLCIVCRLAITQFHQMFPNVSVEVESPEL